MAELLIVLLDVFGEVFLEFGGELLISLGIEAVAAPFKKAQTASLGFSIAGIVLMAAAASCLFCVVVPSQLIHRNRFPGISMLVSPLLAGATLHWFGAWRTEHGKHTTRIATFWGGALFALTFSSIRFLAIRFL
jgi:hypothetical protein